MLPSRVTTPGSQRIVYPQSFTVPALGARSGVIQFCGHATSGVPAPPCEDFAAELPRKTFFYDVGRMTILLCRQRLGRSSVSLSTIVSDCSVVGGGHRSQGVFRGLSGAMRIVKINPARHAKARATVRVRARSRRGCGSLLAVASRSPPSASPAAASLSSIASLQRPRARPAKFTRRRMPLRERPRKAALCRARAA